MKIILSGGGTLGPVTPLLAIREAVIKAYPDAEFVWIGTKKGSEKEFIERYGIRFIPISSGKYRRYFSFKNVSDLIRIAIGFYQSIKILKKEKPDICISAGGFVSVPLHFSANLLKIKTWVHQQDFEIGLSNRLMATRASMVTTSLDSSMYKFPLVKVRWLGNPIRDEIKMGSKERFMQQFGLNPQLPFVFVIGGGTGSAAVNQLVLESLPMLEGVCQIVHLTGETRSQDLAMKAQEQFSHYYQTYPFFGEELRDAYAAADLVICRGGFGTLSEIAALAKPAIIIPKPGHQEKNVEYLENAGAAIYVNETTADGNHLSSVIKELFADNRRRAQMGEQLQTILPRANEENILAIVQELIGS